MAELFNLPPLLGFSQTLKYDHIITNSVTNNDHIVAKHDEPLIEYSYSASLLIDSEKDYVKGFFTDRSGSQDVFLFEDPIDFYATHTEYDTGYEIFTRGVVLEDNGVYFLAKAYGIRISAILSIIYRPITRPKNPINVYDNLGNPVVVTIDYNTGEITSGGASNLYWEGEFYVPVRFQSDILPITIESFKNPNENTEYNRYKIPDLKFIEVKESNHSMSFLLPVSYDHAYLLPFERDISIDNTAKTDIFRNEGMFETRESLGTYRYNISQSNQLLLNSSLQSYHLKEYLVGLYRLCIGSAIPFVITDDTIGFDTYFRFEGDLSFEMTAHDPLEPSIDKSYFSVTSLGFKQFFGTFYLYCHCWKITRADTTVIGVTNYNRKLVIDGVTYYPNDAIASASSTNTAELNIDATEASGAFGTITEFDLVSGKYDNAEIEYFSANWYLKAKIATLFEGNIGGYNIAYVGANGKTFQLDCISKTEVFNRNIPRVTATTCPHTFTEQGYGKCNVTITTAFQQNTTVVSASNDVVTTGVSTIGYEGGVLAFTSGEMSGRRIPIVSISGNDVTLLYPPEIIPSNGDTITITKRCGKTIYDCYEYGNMANFGGQPLSPTTDTKISGADNDVV